MAKWAKVAFLSISTGLALTLFIITSPVLAASALENPGEVYIFGADSPVTATHPASQQSSKISGSIAVWEDSRPDTNCNPCSRIFFKDLSHPGSDEQVLTPGLIQQGTPAISGSLVVWRATYGNTGSRIWYQYMGGPGPGMVSETSTSQSNPAVSGSRIIWQDARTGSSNPQIYEKDLSQGSEMALTSGPGQNVSADIDGDWVVWIHNEGSNLGVPVLNDVVARNVVTGEVRPVTTDGGSVQQGAPAISGSKIVWEVNASNNHALSVYDLNTSETKSVPDSSYATHARIEGNIIVWEKYTTDQIFMHDLTTGITQQVSSGTGASISRPDVTSGYVVWQDDRDGTRSSFMNKIDMNAQQLAEKYAPHLYLHHEEYFQPRKVDIMLAGEGTRLMQRNLGDIFSVKELPDLTMGSLGQYMGSNDQPGNEEYGKYIDLPGNVNSAWWIGRLSEWWLERDFVDRYNDLKNQNDANDEPLYPEMYYAHVVKRADRARFEIQYWIPYYFNNFGKSINNGNYHEGDWEMVQVDLDGSFLPNGVAFSAHTGSLKRSWLYLDHRDTHPVSYVAKGSHANYFAAGDPKVEVDYLRDPTDHAEVNEPIHEPMVEVLPDVSSTNLGSLTNGPFAWLAYQGAWGEVLGIRGFDGPQGPAATPEHNIAWDNSFSWYDGLSNDGAPQYSGDPYSSTYGSVASPVDIHLYDAAGNHVGKNSSAGIDEYIGGADYLEIPELHRKTIIIHNGDASAGYRFVLTGTGEGTFDFTVGSPNKANNSSDTVEFVDVPVAPSTQAEVVLDQNASYTLQIDTDGDGTVDVQKSPDSISSYSIDLNQPGQVHDLSAAAVSNGGVTLSFTAPGDDGNAGTAQYYDIRYSTSPITEEVWKEAKPIEQIPAPQIAGSLESITVADLSQGVTYYFALKAKDEANLDSSLSNVASVRIPLSSLTAGQASAAPTNIDAIKVSTPYANDENANGATLIEYKLTNDASWNEYGLVAHPDSVATITGLSENGAYDVYVTYQDPDGVNGAATQYITNIQLPAPPDSTNVQPSGTIFGGSTTISADLSAGLGINTEAVSVTLDGNALPDCTVTAISVSCPVGGLTFGPHTISGTVADTLGNTAPIGGSFSVGDNTLPTVTAVLPTDTVYGGSTDIRVDYSDPGIASGIDTASVSVYLDGNALTGCTVSEADAVCPASGVAFGTHAITGSVSDRSGNTVPFTGSFNMIEWNEASVMYQSGLIPAQPSLCQLTDGRTLLAFTEQFPNAIKFRVSSDGASWQIPAGSTGTIPYASGVQPSITQLPSGRIVVGYAEYWRNPFYGTYYWVVRVTSSTDLINWTYPVFVGGPNSLAPSVTALDSGQVMLTYTRQFGSSADLYGTSGSFNGSYWSWNSETLVYGGTQYDSKPGIVNAGNNELICAFFSGGPYSTDRSTWTNRDIYAVRSLDNGHTWLNQSPVTVYQGTGSADFWPSLLKLSDGRLICAFTTSEEGTVSQLNIKMVSSSDQGYSWGGQQTISTALHSESWPALAQRPDGSVICVWDSDPGQIDGGYYLYSSRLIFP